MNSFQQDVLGQRLCRRLVMALLFCLASPQAVAQSQVVRLVSDPYPPYVMDEADRKGYVTEMAIRILEDAGYQAEYINVPFKRALLGLERGTYDGLLAVSPGRPGYIYTQHAFGISQTSFFVAKDSTWHYQGTDSLAAIKLGVTHGYEFAGGLPGEYENKIDAYILKNRENGDLIKIASGTDALEKNIRKLALGRIDATLEDAAAFWFMADKMGLADKFKVAGNLTGPEKITIGFNVKNPRARELERLISEGLQKLKDSGEYHEILTKYALHD